MVRRRSGTDDGPIAAVRGHPGARVPVGVHMLVIAILVTVAAAGGPAAGIAAGTTDPRITAVYPNTIYPGNAGEYVVVTFPDSTALTDWSLVAGTTTASLPDERVRGPVVFTTNASATTRIVDGRVIELTDHFTIAEDGGWVRLLHWDRVVDEVRYGSAPVAHRWLSGDDGWRWEPHGMTEFEARAFDVATVTAFAFPDAVGQPESILADARDRILFAGYTLESRRTVEVLIAAVDRGVPVRALVDGSPVGGQTEREARALDALAAAGVDVRVFDGPRKRYRFHHAKYAVVDDRAIVLTENWKPAGTGGRASRGWGVVVDSPSAAAALAAIYDADAGWKDTVPWETYRAGRTFADEPPADGEYPSTFEPAPVPAESVRLIVAPDNAEPAVLELIDGAESTIDIQQVRITDTGLPFLRAAIRAAERGVRVRILLDHSWYIERDNRRLAAELNDLAARRSIPLEARIVEPRARFGKVHTKGVIVDERRVLVGSINWNNNSVRNNREVAVIVSGEEVGAYYTAIFRSDWRGGRWSVPIGFVGAIGLAGTAAVSIGRRRIRFEREVEPSERPACGDSKHR